MSKKSKNCSRPAPPPPREKEQARTTPNYNLNDTIYALASGHGIGGVAVIRISGNLALNALKELSGLSDVKPRYAYYVTIEHDRKILDRAVAIYFQNPNSFTGEDVVELQVHGGRAVIASVLDALSNLPGFRPAEAGEYSRRAVINGKMDLTAAEGFLDLINATTEQQQAQALLQADGALNDLYEGWRGSLVHDMAYLEAFIDFPEEDIPAEKLFEIDTLIETLITKISEHLDDGKRGQKLRDGFQIAIVGAPNAGKSSLINRLTKKDVAIVSTVAGTTRDVVEAYLDVGGFPVIIADTAGLRDTQDEIECEGIARAVKKAGAADLVVHLIDAENPKEKTNFLKGIKADKIITVYNKTDLKKAPKDALAVSAKTGRGVDALWIKIREILETRLGNGQTAHITRERYRTALRECVESLNRARKQTAVELKAEDLRMAARSLGRITGRIDAEELLDVIFRDFCIGK